MAGLLGMDDETLALVGGLLSRGAIGRGINSYLDQKTRAQQLALVEDYKRQKMAEDERKAAEVAARQQAMQAATQPPEWAQNAGPLGAYAKAPSDAESAMGMARVANEPKTMHDLLKLQQDARETFSDPRVAMQNGAPVFMQSGKYGGSRVVPGMEPPPDVQMLDLKDRFAAVDRLRTQAGTTLPIGQSADNKATTGLGYSRLAFEKQKDAADRAAPPKPADVGKLVTDIRKEYNGLEQVKNFRAALPMLQSAKVAPDTPAGDLDIIYAVGKALDPNSVVREGELNLVIKSGSPLQRFQGAVNYIAAGKGRLPPGQRQQLMSMLSNRIGQLKQQHDVAAAPYVKQAQSLGLPMDQIFQEEASPKPPAVGEKKDGYTYIGGDPGNPASWRKD